VAWPLWLPPGYAYAFTHGYQIVLISKICACSVEQCRRKYIIVLISEKSAYFLVVYLFINYDVIVMPDCIFIPKIFICKSKLTS